MKETKAVHTPTNPMIASRDQSYGFESFVRAMSGAVGDKVTGAPCAHASKGMRANRSREPMAGICHGIIATSVVFNEY